MADDQEEIMMDLEEICWSPEGSLLSGSDSWSPYNESEPIAWSTTFDHSLDLQLSRHLEFSPVQVPHSLEHSPKRGRRGRKPLRPQDPVKKKTEEKDKYWLRGFRAYMKLEYERLRPSFVPADQLFWRDHLGAGGKPEKGSA
jgi:hypothetical protein